jgi:hypothetical protein
VGTLNLAGPLDFRGTLTLADTVQVAGVQVLVEASDIGTAPPVILPPPPASPVNPAPQVSILKSFNQTVTAGARPIVTQGMTMQGAPPQWPGMVLPSQGNSGPTAVTVNGLPMNVVGDQGVTFPSGGTSSFGQSGQ